MLPSQQNAIKNANEKVSEVDKQTSPTNTQGVDAFRLSDLLPDGLRALEGLDDMLRSTVPRVDRFNCLERVMCEFASPFNQEPTRGNHIDSDGIHTLQQLHNSQNLPSQLQGQLQHLPQHQQQFLQHQQHQNRLVQQQLNNRKHQQQNGAAPPLPYYIPTNDAHRGEQGGNHFEDNTVRRDEHYLHSQLNYQRRRERGQRQPEPVYQLPGRHQPPQYHQLVQTRQQQQQPAQNQQQQPARQQQQPARQQHQPARQQQQQPAQNQQYQPQHYQVASYVPQAQSHLQPSNVHKRYVAPHAGHYNPSGRQGNRARQQKRRRRPSFTSFIGSMFNGGSNDQRRNSNRRYRRDVEEVQKEQPALKVVSRRSKVAPAFQTDTVTLKEQPELVKTSRTAKMSPSFRSIDAIPKSNNAAPKVKTLTKADLEGIKQRIKFINEEARNNSTGRAFSGRSSGARQGRFLNSVLGGWSSTAILKLLDQLMEGYSFHPYTHAAYMGYSSRQGSCQNMYPRCPDNTNDMLDFVNNFHQYYPQGLPFKDSLPWPLNLLAP